jgi:DNA-binding NarL/FixJ family response regulator
MTWVDPTMPEAGPLPPRRRVVVRSSMRLGGDTLKAFVEARAPELRVETYESDIEIAAQLQIGEPPDLIVWRQKTDEIDPVADVRAALGHLPKTPIVLVVQRYDAALVSRAMAQGIAGLVANTMSADLVLCVLRLMLVGGTYFPCEVTWLAPATVAPVAELPAPVTALRGAYGLTPRQLDVLSYICQGMSNKIIARALGMRETTVKAHVMQIMRRLNADNRTQVALRVSQMGFIGQAREPKGEIAGS